MQTTCDQPRRLGAASSTQWFVWLKPLVGLAVAAFLLALCPAQAEVPDDQYIRIYSMMRQADSLSTNGPAGAALAKYQEALAGLQNFQKTHPDWNPRTVTFRLSYLADKIAAVSKEPAAAGQHAGGASQAKLVEAGAEPRKVLRLHPKPGDKQAVTMTLKMGMEMKIGEMEPPAMKLPAMKMPMDLTVKSVSPTGDITYEMAMGEAEIGEEAGAAPEIAAAVKPFLTKLNGLTGTGTISDRGFSMGIEFKGPADADAQLRQMMDQMKESFFTAMTQFPEEAVGPGAKWEVKMPIKSQGMTIEQSASYELASLEADGLHGTINSTLAQNAANQKVENPAMAGLKLDLTKMTGKGTGKATFDLGQIMPPDATAEFHADMAMKMDAGGQKQTMTMKMDMNMRLEAK